MNRWGRTILALSIPPAISLLLLQVLLLMLIGGESVETDNRLASALSQAGAEVQAVGVLVDDFEPQPLQGKSFWPHNRLGGDRGPIGDEAPPANTKLYWGRGGVTATITGTNAGVGVWTSLNHPIADQTPLDFSTLFPPQITSEYQGHVTGLAIRIRDGVGNLKVELKAPGEVTRWSQNVSLTGGQRDLSFGLPALTETQNLNWVIEGDIGNFVVVDEIVLTAKVPHLTTDQQAFLWSYAMLLANWDSESGLTRDHAYWAANRFDNISASGMQAAAAVMAWRLGYTSWDSATHMVERTTQGMLALPRTCHGLWPHFVENGQIVSGTEWSSIDTVIAAVALIEARQALSLDTTQVEAVLTGIDWSDLITPSGSITGSIGHGYWSDCQPIGGVWRDFGAESWLVNLGYAAATGNIADFDHTPPTYNGSGFIDELAWLLEPAPDFRDRWETKWNEYREQAVITQVNYYQSHPCYANSPRLFGLSAAEVPDLSAVPITQTYQAFGVGGKISPDDGTGWLGHAVVVPHEAGLAASLSSGSDPAVSLWAWLETHRLFTPLNNVESLMVTDEPACTHVTWNALKGSWNLSLQTLGWGRRLTSNDTPLYRAMWDNPILARGYRAMTSWVAIMDHPVFAFPGQPLTVTVAWGNIPTDGRYKLRVQLENKLLSPDVYYAVTDVPSYGATETQTITLTMPTTLPDPPNAIPRYGSRFIAAFISTTCDWCDVWTADWSSPRDVTVDTSPPTGWTSGRFYVTHPDASAYVDPEGQPFYAAGMVYAYENLVGVCEGGKATAVISDLIRIKNMGFNAVNLYTPSGTNHTIGLQQDDCLPEILSWANLNRMAVYVRVSYKHYAEFPDDMDPQYRQQAKDSLEDMLNLARLHPALLAVDLDQRWLFDVDWRGSRRYGVPRLMTYTLAYLPTWLQNRFGTLAALNTAWGKSYVTFTDVLSDTEIVQGGQVVDLDRHPWRVDVVDYTLWVMDDLMADVLAFARRLDPDHLYTYTDDRPEVIPFPISTQASSGIDLISPVHYNFWVDFYRDWVAQAKLTQETLWQRDLYGMPTFVRESGWRTKPLSQTPPLNDYAWSLSDTHKAELYLRQATLMAAYPWVPGWAYFKLYDKPEEGDFGFLDNDGTFRPVAHLATCINPAIPINTTGRPLPQRWVYYPRYALAAPYAAFDYSKTLVDILEHDFFSAYEARVTETLGLIPWPLTHAMTTADCAAVTSSPLFTDLAEAFNERWRSFAFTSTIPTDNLPILLAGRALEPMSLADRDQLAHKRTVTFGPVGISDERYHSTTPWYADVVGFVPPPDRTIRPTWPIADPAVRIVSYPIAAYAGRSVDVGVEWRNLPPDADHTHDLIVQIENWDTQPGVYYQTRLAHFGPTETLTVTLDIPDQVLTYTSPITGARYVAAVIDKVCDWCSVLAFDSTTKQVTLQPQHWVTVMTPGGRACPAWTGWVAAPITGTYRALATFQGGELEGQPAIVQSLDARHTAFLYDALVWKTITSDSEKAQVEASLSCHSLLLQPLSTPALLSPRDGTLTRTTAITLTWSDVQAAGYNLMLNGTALATTTNTFLTTMLPDDIYTWTVRAFNALGEYSPYTTSWTLTVDTHISPTVGLAAIPGSWTNVNLFTVTWANPADLSGIAGVRYSVDMSPTSNLSGTFQSGQGIATLTHLTVTGDGAHPTWVWLMDNAGNVDYTTAQTTLLRYDATPPTNVAVTASGQISAAQFLMRWLAHDVTSGIASYTVEYSGTAYAAWQSWLTNTLAISETFSAPVAGADYVFRVTAFDRADNSAQAITRGAFRIYLPLVVLSASAQGNSTRLGR